jgi:hypothetical protein
MMMGFVTSRFVGGPSRGGLLRGDANFSNMGFVVYDSVVGNRLKSEHAARSFHGCVVDEVVPLCDIDLVMLYVYMCSLIEGERKRIP